MDCVHWRPSVLPVSNVRVRYLRITSVRLPVTVCVSQPGEVLDKFAQSIRLYA
jgi:hypothetical protein